MSSAFIIGISITLVIGFGVIKIMTAIMASEANPTKSAILMLVTVLIGALLIAGVAMACKSVFATTDNVIPDIFEDSKRNPKEEVSVSKLTKNAEGKYVSISNGYYTFQERGIGKATQLRVSDVSVFYDCDADDIPWLETVTKGILFKQTAFTLHLCAEDRDGKEEKK